MAPGQAHDANSTFPLEDRDLSSTTRTTITQLLDHAPEIHHYGDTRIVRISRTAIVKYGTAVSVCEARNMQLVKGRTTIRLPEVLDFWMDDPQNELETGITYITMTFVEGSLLSDVWQSFDLRVRDDILQQICDMLHQLQRIEMLKPGPVGGGISRGDFFTDYGAGPFSSREDMQDWFNDRLLVCQQFGRRHPNQMSFTGQFSRLVMCHMDLHMRNIILDTERRVWLVDWAFAGGYPAWFEQAAIGRLQDDSSFVDGLLDKFGDGKYLKAIDSLEAIGFALTTGALCQPSHSQLS